MTEPRIRSLDSFDPDYRRTPRGRCCLLCQKTLKVSDTIRWMHLLQGRDGVDVIRPEITELLPDDGDDFGWHPVGLHCAKRAGLEWSMVIPEFSVSEKSQ